MDVLLTSMYAIPQIYKYFLVAYIFLHVMPDKVDL